MKKCSWCLNEISENGNETSHGGSNFCSRTCMNEFYKAYPNQKLKDNKIYSMKEGCRSFIGWILILSFLILLSWFLILLSQ